MYIHSRTDLNIIIKMEMKEMSKKGKTLKPIIQIGKSGLTDSMVEHLKTLLKKRKVIKVKLLRSYIEGKDKKEVFNEIASKADAILVDTIGFVLVLGKKE
jgi:RNA-binding protein